MNPYTMQGIGNYFNQITQRRLDEENQANELKRQMDLYAQKQKLAQPQQDIQNDSYMYKNLVDEAATMGTIPDEHRRAIEFYRNRLLTASGFGQGGELAPGAGQPGQPQPQAAPTFDFNAAQIPMGKNLEGQMFELPTNQDTAARSAESKMGRKFQNRQEFKDYVGSGKLPAAPAPKQQTQQQPAQTSGGDYSSEADAIQTRMHEISVLLNSPNLNPLMKPKLQQEAIGLQGKLGDLQRQADAQTKADAKETEANAKESVKADAAIERAITNAYKIPYDQPEEFNARVAEAKSLFNEAVKLGYLPDDRMRTHAQSLKDLKDKRPDVVKYRSNEANKKEATDAKRKAALKKEINPEDVKPPKQPKWSPEQYTQNSVILDRLYNRAKGETSGVRLTTRERTAFADMGFKGITEKSSITPADVKSYTESWKAKYKKEKGTPTAAPGTKKLQTKTAEKKAAAPAATDTGGDFYDAKTGKKLTPAQVKELFKGQ